MHIAKRIAAGAFIMAAPAFIATPAWVASADDRGMSQAEFPCQEDEVLGYAPQFGPDWVGCIHIEDLLR